MINPAIEVQQLSKTYKLQQSGIKTAGDNLKWALRDISFNVMPGQVTGVIGMNGAGKSTLLKVIAQVTQPSAGMVRIDGKVLSILEVGVGFIPELTGRENILLYGDLHGVKRKVMQSRLSEIIQFSEIGEYADEQVKYYSSGMYLRLAFSTIIALEAQIYLFDEIFNVGDIRFRSKVLAYIRKLKEEGKTILVVSHSPSELIGICDQMILLHNGEISSIGNPMEVVQALSRMANSLNAVNNLQTMNFEGVLEGKESFVFHDIKYSGPDGVSNILLRENELTIEMFFGLTEDKPVDVILNINSKYGQTVLSSSTLMDGISVPDKKGNYCARFRIPANFLTPGVYLIKAYFYSRTTQKASGFGSPVCFEITASGNRDKWDLFPGAIYTDVFVDFTKNSET